MSDAATRISPQARRAMKQLIDAVDRTIAAARDAERARAELSKVMGKADKRKAVAVEASNA